MSSEAASASSSSSASNKATVKSGVRSQSVDAGAKVKDLRATWDPLLKFPEGSKAMINGVEASEDSVVAPGDIVEFVKKAAEKG